MTNTYSPILGIATAAFELATAGWALVGLRRGRGRRSVLVLSALLLVCLAAYQIVEVLVCWSGAEPRLFLSRLGFIAVTWLPPLTILLLARLYGPTRPRGRLLLWYGYLSLALAAVMAFWIFVEYRFVSGTICEFMYAKYIHVVPYFDLYGGFYEVTQVASAVLAALCVIHAADAADRRKLGDVLIGIQLYLIPALLVGAVFRGIGGYGLPSIMCHFALAYALCLARMLAREIAPA